MVAVRVLLAALCALLVASAAAAVKVPHLTRKTFDSTVNDGRTHFIKCGHCRNLAPTWAKLHESVKDEPSVAVASVDCTKERKVCDKAGVERFPSLFVYQNGKQGERYTGDRSFEGLRKYLTGHVSKPAAEAAEAAEVAEPKAAKEEL